MSHLSQKRSPLLSIFLQRGETISAVGMEDDVCAKMLEISNVRNVANDYYLLFQFDYKLAQSLELQFVIATKISFIECVCDILLNFSQVSFGQIACQTNTNIWVVAQAL